jgi:hypothetical protein
MPDRERGEVGPPVPPHRPADQQQHPAAATFAVFAPLLSAYSNTSSLSEMPIPPSRLTPNQK